MRKALVSSYGTQAYAGLVGLVVMPVYLHYMGLEALGLIGIHLMVQAWVQMLDLGLSAVFSRELSIIKADSRALDSAPAGVRTLEAVIWGVAATSALLLIAGADWIAARWITSSTMDIGTVSLCVALMGAASSLRLVMGFYRGGLIGLERHYTANAAQVLFATLKHLVVIPCLALFGWGPVGYFAYFAGVSVLESGVFAALLYRVLAAAGLTVQGVPSFSVFKRLWPFASAMAVVSIIWIFTTQIDKLVLSRLLNLREFGDYTAAVAAATGLLLLLPPMNQVIQPRMTVLVRQDKKQELTDLYRLASQVMSLVFFCLGGGLALFAEPLLWAWTGDAGLAARAAPILFWYGLANALIGILLLPYMLQFAFGVLRFHVLASAVSVALLVPLLVVAANLWGARGAGATLFFINLVFMLAWIPIVHAKLLPHLTVSWPLRDILPVAGPSLGLLWLLREILPEPENRVVAATMVCGATGLVLFAGALLRTRTRAAVFGLISKAPL